MGSNIETPQKRIDRLEYRPEIDGLRAIAVLSVFLFHLNHKWLPGGFVGVDIFFVISGYLITSILYNDCNAGKFSFTRFYQRRIARIFPALFTVALATIAGAALIYTPQDFASAGANLVAATLSLANIKYMLQGNYFTVSPDAQPFLHYWSLSVEEQFYMLFPFFLVLLVRYARRHLLLILSAAGVGSFIACVLLTQVKPVWAFYLLPTRAWELCAGCLLAVIPFRTNEAGASAPLYRWISPFGLILIGCALLLVRDDIGFPGWQAAVPVLGAVAIIFPHPGGSGLVEKWLSNPVMVKIGKMSYSLYLWHWPVFSLIDYRLYLLPYEIRLPLKIGLSILLTLMTYHFVENPTRVFLNRPQNNRLAYVALFVVLVLCVPVGFSIRNNYYINADVPDVADGGIAFPGKSDAYSVVLMGDSNGSMYGKIMKDICSDLDSSLTVISVAAGDTLPSRKEEGDTLWQYSLEAVRRIRPDYLVFANLWSSKLRDDPDRLVVALNELKPYVGHIILLNQPPTLPSEASRASIRDGARPPFRENPEIRSERHRANGFLAGLQCPEVSVIDVARYFQLDNGEILLLDEKGRQLFQDSTHLSGWGAERIRGVLKKLLSST